MHCKSDGSLVSNLTSPLPLHHHVSQSFDLPTATVSPHQSIIWLAHCHCITTSLHHRITMYVIWLAYYHCVTTSFSDLTCPLPPYHCITMSVSHCHCITTSPCQSVIWLAHCQCITMSLYQQSLDLSTTSQCHCVSQLFDLPTATTLPHHNVTASLHKIFPIHIGKNLIG